MERLDKIKELINLLSGTNEKQDFIVINDDGCQLGEYNYEGRIITEVEKLELEKRCKILIIFTSVGNRKNDAESSVSEKNLNITADSPATGETLLKLRGIKM